MFFLKKAYCRVFQIGFRAVLPVLPGALLRVSRQAIDAAVAERYAPCERCGVPGCCGDCNANK